MSQKSGLKTMNILLFSSIVGLFSSFAFSQGGIVQGKITDQKHDPLVGMVIYLEGADGYQAQSETDASGRYYFEGIPRGPYILKLDNPRGWEYIKPRAGYYEVFIDYGDHFVFDWMMKDPGIAIDFGNPPVINGDGTSGKNLGDPLVDLTLSGMKTLGEKPLSMELEGEWVWTQGEAAVEITAAFMAGAYTGGAVTYENLGNNRFRLKFSSLGWPGFAFDGDLAQLRLKVKPLNQSAGEVRTRIHSMMVETASSRRHVLGNPSGDRALPRNR